MAKIARVCDAEDCDRPVLARGACTMHYQRAKYGDETVKLRPVREPTNAGRECSIDGCSKPARNMTWCKTHYSRYRQHGDPLRERQPAPAECIKCGAAKDRSPSGRLYCKACANASTKVWRDADPEGYRERQRRAYRRNIATHEAWRRRYYAENREQILEQTAAWQKANPDARRRIAREWAKRNPERCAANAAQRRARKLQAVCEHGPSCVPWDVYQRIKGQLCLYCGEAAAHADHFVPLARGGRHCIKNIVPACERCNRSKGSRMPDEWAEYLRKRGAA